MHLEEETYVDVSSKRKSAGSFAPIDVELIRIVFIENALKLSPKFAPILADISSNTLDICLESRKKLILKVIGINLF